MKHLIRAISRAPGENIVWFAPLLNYRSQVESIQIDQNMEIGRASYKEIELFNNNSDMLDKFNEGYVVRTLVEDDGLLCSPNNCVKTLRLLKSSSIGLGNIIFYNRMTGIFKYKYPNQVPSDYYYDGIEPYVLLETDKDKFYSYYKYLSNSDSLPEAISIALFRYEFSYSQPLLYSPIDLMIGLEALYLSDDKELGYKLALRAAFLLGKNEDDRKLIFNIVKAAYEARGKLVHGKRRPSKFKVGIVWFEIDELVFKVREVLRQSIIAFIKLTQNNSEKYIRDTLLDSLILSGETSTSA